MVGQKFASLAAFDPTTTIGPWGYPVQVALSIDQATLMQFAYKRFPRYASRVTWQIEEVIFPAGDFRWARCYGIRIRSADPDVPANVYAVTVYKEDPIMQGFSFNGPE